MDHAVYRVSSCFAHGRDPDSQLEGASTYAGSASLDSGAGSLPRAGTQGDIALIVAICILFAAALLVYVFAPGVSFERATDKPRLVYLDERKQVIYENLRDLNFDFKAGKYPAEDYESLRNSLEAEAAEVLAEINALQETAQAV